MCFLNVPHPECKTEKQKNAEFERTTMLRCCSGTNCDRRALTFMATFYITFAVSAFCMVQLARVDKCDSDIYITLLTMCLSIWLPSPTLQAKNTLSFSSPNHER